MQKILKILNLLIKSKLSFLPPKKKGILLFDYDGDDVASKILEKNSYEILHTRKEKLNILIILITVLKE